MISLNAYNDAFLIKKKSCNQMNNSFKGSVAIFDDYNFWRGC